jgi:hypothetical protein
VVPELVDEINAMYTSESVSRQARAWNEQRFQALKSAITDVLFPVLRKEVEGRLFQEAREWVAQQMADKMWGKIAMAPWRTKVGKVVGF